MKHLLTLLLLSLLAAAAHAQIDWPIVAGGRLDMGTNAATMAATGIRGYLSIGSPTQFVGAANAMTLASGIPTNMAWTPAAQEVLDVFHTNGNGACNINIIGLTNSTQRILFSDSAQSSMGSVRYYHSSDILGFAAGASGADQVQLTGLGALVLVPQSASPTAVQGGMYFDSDAPPGFFVCTNGTTWVLLK